MIFARITSFLCCLFVFPYVIDASVGNSCGVASQTVAIKNIETSYLLEGFWSDDQVRVRLFYNTTDQLWFIQPSSRIGLFNIINARSKAAMDLGATHDEETDSFNITTATLTDSITQQWFINSDGTIVNANVINHVVDVRDGNYSYANYMVITPSHTNGSAKFTIDFEQNFCEDCFFNTVLTQI